MRLNNRKWNELRPVFLGPGFSKYAEGSCFVKFGDTHVLCTATLDEKVPPFLKNTGSGWVTAEYGMLPRSTHQRLEREATRGKQTGRTQEIQRLIGRCLRAVVNLKALGERQIKIDCDVMQADGGTRTASITGGFVALHQVLKKLVDTKILPQMPIIDQVAAISCGITEDQLLLDLDYGEDSKAEVDANFVMTRSGKIVEIQATAESKAFDSKQFLEMMEVANGGINQLLDLQSTALKI